jgi:hypothetical protein
MRGHLKSLRRFGSSSIIKIFMASPSLKSSLIDALILQKHILQKRVFHVKDKETGKKHDTIKKFSTLLVPIGLKSHFPLWQRRVRGG